MTGKYAIDCHIYLEDTTCNVLHANGGHQVPLSVFYKIFLEEDGSPSAESDKTPEKVQIELFNLETGQPLNLEGWKWSWEEGCTTPLAREASEVGSKPENETGYVKRTVYLSHEISREGQGSVLVGARIHFRDPEEKRTLSVGPSVQGVRVHWLAMKIYGWEAFQASAPVPSAHTGQKPDNWRGSNTNDQSDEKIENLWRAAHVFIKFKDESKSVTRLEISHLAETWPYARRAFGYYQTDAYIWSFASPPQGEQQRWIFFNWPSDLESYSVAFNPGNGFVITLVTYVNIFHPVHEDIEWLNAPSFDVITVYDENDTPITLYLNGYIPNKWTDVLNNRSDHSGDNNFSAVIIGNAPNRLSQRSVSDAVMKNLQYKDKFVKADRKPPEGDDEFPYFICNADEPWTFSFAVKPLDNNSYQRGHINIPAALDNSDGNMKSTEISGRIYFTWSLDNAAAITYRFSPVWDKDGFCISMKAPPAFGDKYVYVIADTPSGPYLFASLYPYSGDSSVWFFEPK